MSKPEQPSEVALLALKVNDYAVEAFGLEIRAKEAEAEVSVLRDAGREFLRAACGFDEGGLSADSSAMIAAAEKFRAVLEPKP